MAAAERLDAAGVDVVVLEAVDAVGGRTRSLLLGPDHRLDAGAAWLTSFYHDTLELAEGLALIPRDIHGVPDLLVDGVRRPAPFGPAELARTPLLSNRERLRFLRWAAGALRRHPLAEVPARVTASDLVSAESAVRAAVGPGVVEHLLRPAFETMVFAELGELSADFVEGWVRAALTARYWVPADGMDAPWRRLAARLDVRTGCAVTSVRRVGGGTGDRVGGGVGDRAGGGEVGGVEVEPVGRFDAAVVAVPAPVAARIVAPGEPGRPGWLGSVRHSAHVLAHAVRTHPCPPEGTDVHPGGAGRHRVGSVALGPGGDGRLPIGMQGATVSAEGWWSAELIAEGLDDEALAARLWDEGRRLEPALFPLDEAVRWAVVRHDHAVPVFEPGHLTRLRDWSPSAPIALAGDWSVYPCIEGAVRSGRRAADVLLAARPPG
jgi:predicted NAD/FAD-dependent oxidoreductase